MNGFLKKLLTWLVLPAIIVALVYAIVTSILKPVNFNKETARRTEVAVQRLKDIRTLQVAYKSVNNKFCSTVDSLKDFYLNGEILVPDGEPYVDGDIAIYYFTNIDGFVRTNPDGQIDPAKVNVIEYR